MHAPGYLRSRWQSRDSFSYIIYISFLPPFSYFSLLELWFLGKWLTSRYPDRSFMSFCHSTLVLACRRVVGNHFFVHLWCCVTPINKFWWIPSWLLSHSYPDVRIHPKTCANLHSRLLTDSAFFPPLLFKAFWITNSIPQITYILSFKAVLPASESEFDSSGRYKVSFGSETLQKPVGALCPA